MKDCLPKHVSNGLSMALSRLEICVEGLFVALSSSIVSVRIHDQMDPAASSKAVKQSTPEHIAYLPERLWWV